jgi:hypothetical protein
MKMSALEPVVLDRHVLGFDVPGFVDAFAECGHITRGSIGRPVSNKPDHRNGSLLRMRRERPRRGAAEQRDELAPLQLIELHPLAQPTRGQHIALVRIKSGARRNAAFRPGFGPVWVDLVEKSRFPLLTKIFLGRWCDSREGPRLLVEKLTGGFDNGLGCHINRRGQFSFVSFEKIATRHFGPFSTASIKTRIPDFGALSAFRQRTNPTFSSRALE